MEEFGALLAGEESGGYTVFAGSAGAAYAVDEIFGDFEQVKIDDVRDVLDVDEPDGDVGRDENSVTA